MPGVHLAAAGIPEYWIVNLRDDRVEIQRQPAPGERLCREQRRAGRGETIELSQLPGAVVAVSDLLSAPAPEPS